MDASRGVKAIAEGSFARHETFCCRYGWLKKGVDGVMEDPELFDRPDAVERLGVGKNMVKSMRFWCVAFHAVEPVDASAASRLSGPMRVTPLGRSLLADDGWDPYLEDPASLWLLHWSLFAPPVVAAAWPLAFNRVRPGSFTAGDLARILDEGRARIPALARYSSSSVARDASCLVRTYAPVSPASGPGEIECPFTRLGLLVPAEEKGAFRFNPDDKEGLPDEIFLAACLDYARRVRPGLRTLSLSALLYEPCSPGMAFKLPETDAGHRLERCARGLSGASFLEIHGSWQLQFDAPPEVLFREVLEGYYASEGGA